MTSPELSIIVVMILAWGQGHCSQVWRCRSSVDGDSYMDNICRQRCVKGKCEPYCVCNMTEVAESCGPLDFAPDDYISVDETAAPGTHMFTIPIKDQETWTYTLERSKNIDGSLWRELKTYFNFKKYGSEYEMIVDKTPDLENIFLKYSVKLEALRLMITCSSPGAQDELRNFVHDVRSDYYKVMMKALKFNIMRRPERPPPLSTPRFTILCVKDAKRFTGCDDQSAVKELFVHINPVNEYSPQFIGLPLEVSVPENAPVGSQVFSMAKVTIDRDVNPATNELSYFRLHKYKADLNNTLKSNLDSMDYFSMSDIQKGNINVKEHLDYEALRSIGATRFVLNISATDIHGWRSFTTLHIDVTDINDLPPEFTHPSCPPHIPRSRPCPVSFEANIKPGFEGPIRHIVPVAIHARDMDAIGVNIILSLDKGPWELTGFRTNRSPSQLTPMGAYGTGICQALKYYIVKRSSTAFSQVLIENAEKFSIDNTSGIVTVHSPFLKPTEIDLVVVAKENSTLERTTQASLKVFVRSDKNGQVVRLTGFTGPPLPNETVRKSEEVKSEDNKVFFIIIGALSALVVILTIVSIWILCTIKKQNSENKVHPDPVNNMTHSNPPSSYHYSQDSQATDKGLDLDPDWSRSYTSRVSSVGKLKSPGARSNPSDNFLASGMVNQSSHNNKFVLDSHKSRSDSRNKRSKRIKRQIINDAYQEKSGYINGDAAGRKSTKQTNNPLMINENTSTDDNSFSTLESSTVQTQTHADMASQQGRHSNCRLEKTKSASNDFEAQQSGRRSVGKPRTPLNDQSQFVQNVNEGNIPYSGQEKKFNSVGMNKKNMASSVKERRIRIPSGVLIMTQADHKHELENSYSESNSLSDVFDDGSSSCAEAITPTNPADKHHVSFQLNPIVTDNDVLSILPMEHSSGVSEDDHFAKSKHHIRRPKKPDFNLSHRNSVIPEHEEQGVDPKPESESHVNSPHVVNIHNHGNISQDCTIDPDSFYDRPVPYKPSKLPALHNPRKSLPPLDSTFYRNQERAHSEDILNGRPPKLRDMPETERCYSLEDKISAENYEVRKKKRQRRAWIRRQRQQSSSLDVHQEMG